ncbi:MAG: amidase [Chloroflexota bacterium]
MNTLKLSASQIAQHIREGKVSVTDTVEQHIQRIQKVNPRINAVITPMYDTARQQAKDADTHIATHGTDDLPPLFGVPVTIKDSWGIEGVRFTGGSTYHADDIAEQDAQVVKRFKEAGAIILGKTNLPDMCWSGETVNPIFGRTNNPHNINHSAGGSSGGEGAIIAAGGSPLGIGSDIAGSVRIPAAMNGCVSLKPTHGRVPSHDHFPKPSDQHPDWNTAGPMARRIEDLALAMSVLSETPFADYREIDLANRRCVVYIHNGLVPVRKEVVETVSTAMGTLKHAGMETVRDDTLPIRDMTFAYAHLMSKYGNDAFKTALGGGKKYSLWEEINYIRKGEGRISANVLNFTHSMDVFAPMAYLTGGTNFRKVDQYKQQLLSAMGEDGVLLCPIIITTPPKHGWVYTLITQVPYTTPFNLVGFPAVVLPIGYTKKGLPLAVQIVARPDEDETALAVAAELERVYGGWRMAKM